jgi:hypothetical protein
MSELESRKGYHAEAERYAEEHPDLEADFEEWADSKQSAEISWSFSTPRGRDATRAEDLFKAIASHIAVEFGLCSSDHAEPWSVLLTSMLMYMRKRRWEGLRVGGYGTVPEIPGLPEEVELKAFRDQHIEPITNPPGARVWRELSESEQEELARLQEAVLEAREKQPYRSFQHGSIEHVFKTLSDYIEAQPHVAFEIDTGSPEQAARLHERRWTLTGSDQAGHEGFEQLARRAIADLGQKFSDPDEAVDNWLELVFEYWKAGRLYDEDDWRLKSAAEKSVLYCAELATCFHEAANLEAERAFTDLGSKFRQLPKDLHAIRRTDARPKAIAIRAAVHAADFWERLEREAVDHASVILGARMFAEGDFREWQIIDGAGKDPKPAVSHEVEVLQDLMNRADAGPTGAVQPDGWKSFLDKQRNSPSYRVIGRNDKSGAVSGEIQGTWFDERDKLQQLGLFKLLATHCRKQAGLARCGLVIGADNSAAGPEAWRGSRWRKTETASR